MNTSTGTRHCPFHDCPVDDLSHEMFACRKHWFSLSMAQRFRINSAFRDYRDDKISLIQLRRIQQSVLGSRGTA